MDTGVLEKLLSYETSNEEREMLCEVAYGRPFSECLDEIRHDDFTLGLESGKYKILSIGSTGEKQESVEIRFICAKCGILELPESFFISIRRTFDPRRHIRNKRPASLAVAATSA